MAMILNSVIPIFLIIGLGSALKVARLIDEQFSKVTDRLIYYIFFPALLFWKIGAPSRGAEIDWALIAAVFCAIFATFVVSLIYLKVSRADDYKVGTFSQSCYRFNTYVGMAVILTALGEDGARQFGVLIGFVIPFINVLSVGILIWYSGRSYRFSDNARFLFKALISNPLIVACILGILYSSLKTPLPRFVDNAFSLIAMLSLPLALISIGGALTFDKFRGYFWPALATSLFKLVFLPLAGYVALQLFQVGAIPLKVGMIYFALPTSPAIYILSGQLNSDVDLATAAIVLSVLFSIVSLSVTLFIFGG